MTSTARAIGSAQAMRTREQQGRVLLVTDDPAVAAYRTLLEGVGFIVTDVTRGAAAIIALRHTRPHVVVAHNRLRGITAEELARSLLEARDGVPLVLIGAEEAISARRSAAMIAGAFDYFQIPNDNDLLIWRIKQLVEVKETIDRLRAEAERDHLTGLANRRRFRTAFAQEVERWRRYNVPCALLLVDIDFLKRINDTHGHDAGDVVIRQVANALTEFSRDNDTAARLGGEEFALLLAGTTDERAAVVAERLLQHIAATPIENIGTVTVSIGVAACPVHATTERLLYLASDDSLYEAKGAGRNRIAVARTTPNVLPSTVSKIH
ncbi:MAG: diguanylate cyclase [Pyrinomonadaceae bacterium MAG19_C2-C3]|nr:diguanylate cyclase [Pyrinomonadaceae bacterium MAG19_C2-C3]